jgi:hypothetical protein
MVSETIRNLKKYPTETDFEELNEYLSPYTSEG